MEREIKFRGKRIDNGEWVYGYFSQNRIGQAIISNYGIEDWVINPGTVGQYTGLKDKNGKEIYEGDRCVHDSGFDGHISWNQQAAQWWNVSTTYMELHSGSTYGDDTGIYNQSIEIIGNIHEEQLKE